MANAYLHSIDKELDASALQSLLPSQKILKMNDPSLVERHIDLLTTTTDEFLDEHWKQIHWLNAYLKEQGSLLDKESSSVLVKLISNEPSRLDALLISNQLEGLADELNELAELDQARLECIRALRGQQGE